MVFAGLVVVLAGGRGGERLFRVAGILIVVGAVLFVVGLVGA
jgi:hypothetical protein